MDEKYPDLKLYSREDILELSTYREGELKLAERIQLPIDQSLEKSLSQSNASFALVGIEEDIGIRGNLGHPGARHAFEHTLKALLAVQSNRFLGGDEILLLGSLQFDSLLQEADGLSTNQAEDVKRFRELTARVDDAVYPVIEAIVQAGKIPIVIGGGHNNSYGNLKGCSKATGQAIACLNIDPHADFRALEGRHSGNGFSYARDEDYLSRYAIFGLHQGYNSEAMLEELTSDRKITFQTFESLLPLSSAELQQRFKNLLQWCGQGPFGLELDLDALTAFPVSALNPSGFSLNQARLLTSAAAALKAPHYFHICEGSPGRAQNENEKTLIGKSIAYLICDFVKNFRP